MNPQNALIKKIICLTQFVVVLLFSNSGVCQINLTRYLDKSLTPFLNPADYVDVKFKWNMKGNVQVFLNEGLNDLKEGHPQQAISNFNEAIKLDSEDWVIYYYRG